MNFIGIFPRFQRHRWFQIFYHWSRLDGQNFYRIPLFSITSVVIYSAAFSIWVHYVRMQPPSTLHLPLGFHFLCFKRVFEVHFVISIGMNINSKELVKYLLYIIYMFKCSMVRSQVNQSLKRRTISTFIIDEFRIDATPILTPPHI